jgi:F-box/leucine-rich repeat protein 2/20
MRQASKVDTEVMEAIALHCPNLKLVDATQTTCKSKGFNALFSSCTKLEEITLRNTDTSDPVVETMCLNIGSTLLRLDLTYCVNITDHALQLLGEYCTNLCRLDLQQCVLITDNGLEMLHKGVVHLEVMSVLTL